MKWVCSVCGYTHEGDQPPEKCPQCGHYMSEKRNNKGETIHLCTNENCRFKKVVAVSGEEDNE